MSAAAIAGFWFGVPVGMVLTLALLFCVPWAIAAINAYQGRRP